MGVIEGAVVGVAAGVVLMVAVVAMARVTLTGLFGDTSCHEIEKGLEH